MNKEQAINYLKSSGMSNEQIVTIAKAFVDDFMETALNKIFLKMDKSVENPDCALGMAVAMGILKQMGDEYEKC